MEINLDLISLGLLDFLYLLEYLLKSAARHLFSRSTLVLYERWARETEIVCSPLVSPKKHADC